MTKSLDEYQSPTHKVLALLHTIRDRLREKYRFLREELRVCENQVRAVEASRSFGGNAPKRLSVNLEELKKTKRFHS